MAIYQDSIVVNQPLLLISGQTPQNGEKIPHSFETQMEIVINKLDTIIKQHNATKGDIVKMGIYLTDVTYLPIFREKLSNYLGETKPVMTLVIVSGLVHPDFKVEIDATVALKE